MGRHYLANRKPQRIERIRRKVAEMLERGIPLDRLDQKWGGHEMPLDRLLFRLDNLGYTVLCNIENLLEMVDSGYSSAIDEAVTEIAYLAGWTRVSVEDVIVMASEICPPPTDGKYEARGIDPDTEIASYHAHRESPFHFLRRPSRMAGTFYEWRFLWRLSLAQLELLTERLRNRGSTQSSAVLRWTPDTTNSR